MEADFRAVRDMENRFLNLTEESLVREHQRCIIRSQKPHPGVEAKRVWRPERLREGHVFRSWTSRVWCSSSTPPWRPPGRCQGPGEVRRAYAGGENTEGPAFRPGLRGEVWFGILHGSVYRMFFACILCHSLHWPENRAPFLSDPCGAVSFVSGALEQKHGINRSLPPLFCCTYLSIISSAFQVLDRISHRTNDILRHTSRQTVPLPQSNADRKGERASRPLWQKLSGFSPLLARTT